MSSRDRIQRGPCAVVAAAVVLLVGCSSEAACTPGPSAPGSCPDLRFQGDAYDEWREVDPPPILQELGNATYPACNAAERCEVDDLAGFGSTDVWLVEGVDPTEAVIGLREGTHTYVIFVRLGVDRETFESVIEPIGDNGN